MIEIILRDDIGAYEPKPLFGFTYRQVATVVIAGAASIAIGLASWSLAANDTLTALLVVGVGAGIGFVGMGRVDGLRSDKWLRIWWEDQRWPRVALLSPVTLSSGRERAEARAKAQAPRHERRRRMARRRAAMATTEISPDQLIEED